MALRVLPSCKPSPIAWGSDNLTNLDTTPVAHDTLKADIQLIRSKNIIIFRGTSVETVVPKLKYLAILRESGKG